MIKRLQICEILLLPWPIQIYQPIVKPSLQYPIELDIVIALFPLLEKSPICD